MFSRKHRKYTPRALIHYSEDDLSVFEDGHFQTRTQGRLYTIDLARIGNGSITKSITPKCALLFTDAALKKFKPHTAVTFFFYKRLFGQYRSTHFGDITWSKSDIKKEGSILQITNVNIVKITDPKRHLQQKIKVISVRLFDLIGATIPLTALGLIAVEIIELYYPNDITMSLLKFIYPKTTWLSTSPNTPSLLILFLIIILAGSIIGVIRNSTKKLKTESFTSDLKKLGF